MPEVFDNCAPVISGITPNCDAQNKMGGVNKRIWVGSLGDIDPAVLAFGSFGEIVAFAMISGKYLYQFVSKKYKQAGRAEEVINENGPVTWNHFVDMVHYYSGQNQINAIENLCKAEDLFAIVQENGGEIKVYGLSSSATLGYFNFGLSTRTGGSNAQTTGVALGDDSTSKTTLGGEVPNLPMVYKPIETLADNVDELDGMSYTNSGS